MKNQLDNRILLRIDNNTKKVLENQAELHERSLSGQVRAVLKEYVKTINI